MSMSAPGRAVALACEPKLPTLQPGQMPSAASVITACACCTALSSACAFRSQSLPHVRCRPTCVPTLPDERVLLLQSDAFRLTWHMMQQDAHFLKTTIGAMHAGHVAVSGSAPHHCGGCQLRKASNLPVQLRQASLQGSRRPMQSSNPAVRKRSRIATHICICDN